MGTASVTCLACCRDWIAWAVRGIRWGSMRFGYRPFYSSPMVDFGYDVSDHCAVDATFGTLEDFDALLAAAHARGIRVLVDYVPNHTSDRHQWFCDARSSRASGRRDWYLWADPARGGGPPNNWPSAFAAIGPAWTLDASSGQYYLHSYSSPQPDLKWQNPEVRMR